MSKMSKMYAYIYGHMFFLLYVSLCLSFSSFFSFFPFCSCLHFISFLEVLVVELDAVAVLRVEGLRLELVRRARGALDVQRRGEHHVHALRARRRALQQPVRRRAHLRGTP